MPEQLCAFVLNISKCDLRRPQSPTVTHSVLSVSGAPPLLSSRSPAVLYQSAVLCLCLFS